MDSLSCTWQPQDFFDRQHRGLTAAAVQHLSGNSRAGRCCVLWWRLQRSGIFISCGDGRGTTVEQCSAVSSRK
jgi:hypothetical protein